jgi:hypothetical protein
MDAAAKTPSGSPENLRRSAAPGHIHGTASTVPYSMSEIDHKDETHVRRVR